MRREPALLVPSLVDLPVGAVGPVRVRKGNEADRTWRAWVSWVQETDGPRAHTVARARAGGLRLLGLLEARQQVPRRVRRRAGQSRDTGADGDG